MIPSTLGNPFIKQQIGHELVPPPGNIPDLHKEVKDQCRRLVKQIRDSGTGTSLLVRGEAGSGKSHLITQLRAEFADDPAAFVIRIPLDKAYVGHVWRYVRKLTAEEMLRKRWHPQHHDLTGLLRIVQNAFPGWSEAGRPGVFGILGNRSAAQDLQERLTLFADENELAYELRQVLPKLWQPGTATLAGDWLRGKSLAEEDLKKLGLPVNYPSDFEQEQIARDVVASLCRLAAPKTALIICFDEVEALLSGGDDTVALRSFTTLVTDLIAEPGPRLVTTFVRPQTIIALRTHVEHSNRQKMSQTEAAIPPLGWEGMVQLVLARLHADPECRAGRLRYPHNQYWPFTEEFLRDFYTREHRDLTPRHVLRACQVEFERLRKSPSSQPPVPTEKPTAEQKPTRPEPSAKAPPPVAKVEPPAPPLQSLPPPESGINPSQMQQLWQKRRNHHLSHLHALTFEAVMGNGLRWLAQITGAQYQMSGTKDNRLGDVNLVFSPTTPGGKSVGVSFCHQDPHSLWRRLDRLINQTQAAKAHNLLGKMVLVRLAEPPLSAASGERVEKIRRGGATVLLLPKEQMAELAAFQELHSKAQTGGITDLGRPITAEQYDGWAKENLTCAVKDLAATVFGNPGSTAQPPTAITASAAPGAGTGDTTRLFEPGEPVAKVPGPASCSAATGKADGKKSVTRK